MNIFRSQLALRTEAKERLGGEKLWLCKALKAWMRKIRVVQCLVHQSKRSICSCIPNSELRRLPAASQERRTRPRSTGPGATRREPFRPRSRTFPKGNVVRTNFTEGSFSAVSKLDFASKYAFESSRRDLHNSFLCTALEAHFLSKICQKPRGILQNRQN